MPRKKASCVRYPGDLGKPPKLPGLINMPSNISDWAFREYCRRLFLLAEFHGVPPKRLDLLAVALAEAHVPGLQFSSLGRDEPRRGKDKIWTIPRLMMLFEAVEDLRAKTSGLTVRDACKRLATSRKYAANWSRSRQSKSLDQWVETLESRYQDGKRLQKGTKGLRRTHTKK
ncbi:MAG: hypothetical protein KGO02_26005 [Alphaproteobacteria bacterium]|nr:hypothetical protein [Alphaproteobacteria bacterium]